MKKTKELLKKKPKGSVSILIGVKEELWNAKTKRDYFVRRKTSSLRRGNVSRVPQFSAQS
jgi:hypothetical protein